MKQSSVYLLLSALFSLILIFVLRWQGKELITALTPNGILALEFANTPEKLATVLSIWNKQAVQNNILLDFLFVIAYTAFFIFGVANSAVQWTNRFMQQLGATGIRMAFLAGILDVVENILMLQSINGYYSLWSLQLTWYCAAIKFGIVILLLLFMLLTTMRRLFKRN
ncbi:MAG: hypothetical protein IBJ16_14410 [Chitinophagaceae bacterium]|nr:hypothetical protein [Chitinophagaceae bacterium]